MADALHDAIALLKADHRKVEDLFARFEAAGEADKKKHLARQICTELTVHTILEEEIFYPACKGKIEDDLVNEAYVEHDGAKVLIAEIEAGGPDQEFYDAKVKVLSEQNRTPRPRRRKEVGRDVLPGASGRARHRRPWRSHAGAQEGVDGAVRG
jgi:hypothetical protein